MTALLGSLRASTPLHLSSRVSSSTSSSRSSSIRPSGTTLLLHPLPASASLRPATSPLAANSNKDNGRGVEQAPSLASGSEAEEGREQSSAAASTSAPSFVPYPAIAALASVGVAETAYLTWAKLAGSSVACPLSGCDTVLSSGYAQLFGVPLSLLGMLTYGSVVAAALVAQQQQQDRSLLNTGLAAGVSVLAGVSGFLIYLLQTEFSGQPCAWCYLSASLSLSLAATIVGSLPKRQLKQVAGPSLGTLACAVLVLYFGTGSVGSSTAANFELAYEPPAVTTTSSDRAIAIAKRLQDAGARMYGAFWCSHCFDQKQEFGQQAMSSFPYVECFPSGWKRGTKEADACEAAGVRAFPTWIINGKTIEGELTFDELEAELAGRPASNR